MGPPGTSQVFVVAAIGDGALDPEERFLSIMQEHVQELETCHGAAATMARSEALRRVATANVGGLPDEAVEEAIAEGEYDGIVLSRAMHLLRKAQDLGLDVGGED